MRKMSGTIFGRLFRRIGFEGDGSRGRSGVPAVLCAIALATALLVHPGHLPRQYVADARTPSDSDGGDGTTGGPPPPTIQLTPNPMVGDQGGSGTVHVTEISAVATIVTLNSESPYAAVPSQVILPANTGSVGFPVTTTDPTSNQTPTISCRVRGVSGTGTFTLDAINTNISGMSVSADPAAPGTSVNATIRLPAASSAGQGLTVTSSDNTDVPVPATIAVPSGSSTVTFPIAISPAAPSETVTITANGGGTTASATLTIAQTKLAGLTIAPAEVSGSSGATGTVTLNDAPAGSYTIDLVSSNTAVATVPASVTLTTGQKSATFPIATVQPSIDTQLSITASDGAGDVLDGDLQVDSGPSISAFTLNPVKVVGSHSATGKITLVAGAPAVGETVTLTNGNPSVITIPASVDFAAGQTSAQFPISTAGVQATSTVPITATAAGSSVDADLEVTFEILRISFSPDNVTGGHSTTGTVTLSAPAAADQTIDFKSTNAPVAPVPRPIVISAGKTQGTFKIITPKVTTATTVSIEAYGTGAGHLSENLTVSPP